MFLCLLNWHVLTYHRWTGLLQNQPTKLWVVLLIYPERLFCDIASLLPHIYICVCMWTVYTHTTSLKSTEYSGCTEMQHIVSCLLCFCPMQKLISVPLHFIIILSYEERLILIFYMQQGQGQWVCFLEGVLMSIWVGFVPTWRSPLWRIKNQKEEALQTSAGINWRALSEELFWCRCVVLFKICCCSQGMCSAGHKDKFSLKQT